MAWVNGPRTSLAASMRQTPSGSDEMVRQWAKTRFLSGLENLRGGTLTLQCAGRTHRFGSPGDLDGTLIVHNERFFLRALTGNDIGIGESFMDGDWSSPDPVPLARL